VDWWPESDEDYERARRELKKRFAAWTAAHGGDVDADAPESAIHYKWTYVDGHLTRWTRADLDAVYLELHPAKVIVEEDDLDGVLSEAKAFIAFLAETGLLDADSDPADVLLAHLDEIEEDFRANMADTTLFSPGKRLWTTAGAEGVRLDSQESLQAFMADFNARPLAERDAVLGRAPLDPRRPRPSGRFTPPGTPPRARSSSAKRRKRRH